MNEIDVIIKAGIGGLVILGIAILNSKAGAKMAAILSFVPVFSFLGILFVGQDAEKSGENTTQVIHDYLYGLFIAAPIMLVFLALIYFLIERFSLSITILFSLLVWLFLSIAIIVIVN